MGLSVDVFLPLSVKYLEVRLLNHMIPVYLKKKKKKKKLLKLFSKMAASFSYSISNGDFQLCHNPVITLLIFLILVTIKCLQWHFNMILTCISLLTNDVSIVVCQYHFFFFFFRSAPAAYRSSGARG